MLDLQTTLTAMVQQRRQEELKNSPQILLGELIAKLEAILDRTKEVVFDFDGMIPTELDSWRGSYCELAIGYDSSATPPTLEKFLEMLKGAVGKTYEGYKGGDFVMGKATPVWIANYGRSCVESASYDDTVGIVDVENGEKIKLITRQIDY